jgi:hypothetical protein
VRTVNNKEGDDRFGTLAERYTAYEVYDRDYESIGKVDDLFPDEVDNPVNMGAVLGLTGTMSPPIPWETVEARLEIEEPEPTAPIGPNCGRRRVAGEALRG